MMPAEKLEFLGNKLRLMSPYLDPAVTKAFEDFMENVLKNPSSLPQTAFDDIDQEFEKLILGRVSSDARASISSSLSARFGYASFGTSPLACLKMVRKRGKVLNETEAKVVQDHLAGDYGGFALSENEKIKLGELLNAYDSSRRES